MGERLPRNVFIELDSPESCAEFVRGLRLIRCEKSMLFTQKLAKNEEEGIL